MQHTRRPIAAIAVDQLWFDSNNITIRNDNFNPMYFKFARQNSIESVTLYNIKWSELILNELVQLGLNSI